MTLEDMKIGELKSNIAALKDKVDIPASDLKNYFDQNPIQIKNAFDDLITFLQNTNTGSSAAAQIGSETIQGVDGTNVRSQIVSLKEQMKGLADGYVFNASITSEKLAAGAVVGAIADGEIPARLLGTGAAAGNLTAGSILKDMLEAVVQQAMFSPGDIKWRAANTDDIPGWIKCDGRALPWAQYPRLYEAIGQDFSRYPEDQPVADGYFRVPNLKGCVPTAFDGAQAEFNIFGARGGSMAETLSEEQMPAHRHGQDGHSHSNQPHNHKTYSTYSFWIPPSGGTPAYATDNFMGNYNHQENWTDYSTINMSTETPQIYPTGGGKAHNNLQPYVVLQAYIKT